jgi:peptidoglycan/xylan/chitin deacetylase (PgdA/CDA1 family)
MRAVLAYHSIDDSGSPISVPPDALAEHVWWLTHGGPRVLPLDELLALDPADPTDAVAITFDDGFANFVGAAARIRDAGLPVTLFVVTGHMGRDNTWGGRQDPGIPVLPLLDWDALDDLAARGVSIGAHTRTHARLPGRSRAEIEDEMDGCQEDLRQRLGVRAEHFAYPYGAVDESTAELASSRFSAALTTEFGHVTGREPRALIPRLDMYYFSQPGALETWGTRWFSGRLWSVRMRRRVRRRLWEAFQ